MSGARWAIWSSLAGLALLPVLVGSTPRLPTHLYLEAEFPKADTSITYPAEIVVFFSQEPLPNKTQIHLFDAAGKELALGPVYADSASSFVYHANIPRELPPARYMVRWETWSDDEPGGMQFLGNWKFTVIAK
jgi:methionine-rich copper-binding protein CopC